jgi:hypothetical protein
MGSLKVVLLVVTLIGWNLSCHAHPPQTTTTANIKMLRAMIRQVYDQDTVTTAQLNTLLQARDNALSDLTGYRTWLAAREREVYECDQVLNRFAIRLQNPEGAQ